MRTTLAVLSAALVLAGCKPDSPSATLQPDGTLHNADHSFAWAPPLDDLDADATVLARGVWQEPDGDVVTCTVWDGNLCTDSRESDDSLDTLESLGLVAAGALTGSALSSAKTKASRGAWGAPVSAKEKARKKRTTSAWSSRSRMQSSTRRRR